MLHGLDDHPGRASSISNSIGHFVPCRQIEAPYTGRCGLSEGHNDVRSAIDDP